jgi:Ni2+-binding GTPase involved in maturation of urease and hydrogenase
MKIHLLSGFLGSGKTTAIRSACRVLASEGVRVGVITNDQGIRLVDADWFMHLGIPGRQVPNGCFCCNYRDLDRQIQSLADTEAPDLIFAESVGSCTDIMATVFKPLRVYRPDAPVTLSVFADALLLHMLLVEQASLFEETVNYIYFKQLEEAGLLIVNKADLLKPSQQEALEQMLQNRYGHKPLLFQDSENERSIRQWLETLNQLPVTPGSSLPEVDYDIYGAGEASLAWLDQEIEISSPSGTANRSAVDLARNIYEKIREKHYPVGHLKFLLNNQEKISFTATAPANIVFEVLPAASATLLLNARVQTEPALLSALVDESIREAGARQDIRVQTRSVAAFQPGYPRPTHRMA